MLFLSSLIEIIFRVTPITTDLYKSISYGSIQLHNQVNVGKSRKIKLIDYLRFIALEGNF